MDVLFLCSDNSSRSIMAEAILNARAEGRLRAYSAGSRPCDSVHPLAVETLQTVDLPTAGLRSKSWEEFAADSAPHMDVVITVCDQAAAEACLIWPGAPVRAHWGMPDPAALAGDLDQQRRAFAQAFMLLERRIEMLLNLPLDFLSPEELQQQLRAIP